ncbi:MAG: NADH-quinone oxidoreductase subunit N [Proteobacteria bacterium]|nr:NADH-quinone oxidoreductase subunit N [Pseudomonadota bacterium]
MMVDLLAPLAADAILVIGALSLLLVDLILPPGEKRILGYGTIGVLLAALISTFALDLSGEAVGGAYEGDALALFFKRGFYVSAILASLASLDFGAKIWPRRQGEYFQLLLYSVLGMSLLAGVRDLLLLAVAFELMGVPLYAMAAFSRKDKLAVEGGLKLYLTGAVSSAVTLYGMSMLFGASGSTNLAEIASAPSSPMLAMGVALTLAGMGFKLGVAPFHMWVPDTYRGSPPPFVVLVAVAPKIAGIAALTRLLLAGDGALLDSVSELLLLLAWFTVIVGNVMALPQDSVRRLLGFSGVGHMGLLLLGLTTGTAEGIAAMLFYVAGYIFTTAGALLVLSAVADEDGNDGLARFAGLSQRSGFLAFAMLVFLLSLGGIPFVVGFWAKLYLFLAAWGAGYQLSVLFIALVGVIGLYYYLRVSRAMYMTEPTVEGPISVDLGTQLAIALCLVFVVGMGLVPQPFVAVAETAASVLR